MDYAHGYTHIKSILNCAPARLSQGVTGADLHAEMFACLTNAGLLQAGSVGPSRSLVSYLLLMARTVIDAARLSTARLQALVEGIPQLQVIH